MKPTNMLINAISARDTRRIASALVGYIFVDRTMTDFLEAVRYTQHQGIPDNELFKEYDSSSRPIDNDPSHWNEDYYCTALSGLENNFCRERINHLHKVSEKVYKRDFEKKSAQKQSANMTASTQVNKNAPKKDQRREKKIVLPAVIALTLVVIVTIVLVFVFTKGN